jgi:hypothetical protein
LKEIPHVYLDLDEGGAVKLKAIRHDDVMPVLNYVLNTSPGKFQVSWRVEAIGQDQAEEMLRTFAQRYGGYPAATDRPKKTGCMQCAGSSPEKTRTKSSAKSPATGARTCTLVKNDSTKLVAEAKPRPCYYAEHALGWESPAHSVPGQPTWLTSIFPYRF